MPKANLGTAREPVEKGDSELLRKLNRHNKKVLQQRMEQKKEAVEDLKERLKQWQEKKRMKKLTEMEQKKEAKRFVTLVTKPVQQTVKSVPAPSKKPVLPPPRKASVITTLPPHKPTVTDQAAKNSRRVTYSAAQNSMPLIINRASSAIVPIKLGPSAASGGPRQSMPVGRGGNSKSVTTGQTRPVVSRPQPEAQKENQRPLAAKTTATKAAKKQTGKPRPSATAKPTTTAGGVKAKTHAKKTSGTVTTPLSGNAPGFGKRHMIASMMTEGGGEGEMKEEEGMDLADDLQEACTIATHEAAATSAKNAEHSPPTLALCETFTANAVVDLPHEESVRNSGHKSSRAPLRNSLTSQFRKAKHQPSLGVKRTTLSGGRTAAGSASKAMRKRLSGGKAGKHSNTTSTRSAARPGSSLARPRKSILKKAPSPGRSPPPGTSMEPLQDNMGASPVLRPRQTKQSEAINADGAGTSSVGVPGTGGSNAVGEQGALAAGGHVAFLSPQAGGGMEGAGATYRKTPGKTRTEDLMKAKLNEWLAARGRNTPSLLRHEGCFHSASCGPSQQSSAHRAQMRACMTVGQLSRQEKALAEEEELQNIRKRLQWTDVKAASSSSFSRKAESRQGRSAATTSSNQLDNNENAELGTAVDHVASLPSAPDLTCSDKVTEEQLAAEYEKCLTALDNGLLKAEEAVQWLDSVSEATEQRVLGDAGWFRCRIRALSSVGDEDAVLGAFHQAIVHNAQPSDMLAELLTSTMKQMLSSHRHTDAPRTRTSSAALTKRARARSCGPAVKVSSEEVTKTENVFQSTTVRYSVREVTPFKKRRTGDGDRLISIITPVRRSTRLSTSTPIHTPLASKGRVAPNTPHVVAEFSTLEEVPSAEKERMLYHPNTALSVMMDESTSPDQSTVEESEEK